MNRYSIFDEQNNFIETKEMSEEDAIAMAIQGYKCVKEE